MAAVTLATLLALPGAAYAQSSCTEDLDCDGENVCRNGQCVPQGSSGEVAAPVPAPAPAPTPVDETGEEATGAPEPASAVAPEPAARTSPPPDTTGMTGADIGPSIEYETEEQRIKALLITGPIMFAGLYGVTIGLSRAFVSEPDAEYWEFSAIPIVGPWIFAALPTTTDGLGKAGLAVSGVGQLGGIVIFIVGMFVKREVKVPKVAVTPIGTTGMGVSIGGHLPQAL